MKFKHSLVIVLAALSLTAACASVPAKQRAVVAYRGAQSQLELLQDTERRLCNQASFDASPMTPITECAGQVASALGLTTAKHQEFAKAMATAYAAQVRLGGVLQAWQPGQAVPPDVATLEGQIRTAITLARTLAATDAQKNLLDVADAALQEVLKIVAVVRGQ